MIDYEMVRDHLEELRRQALHRAEVRRLLAGSGSDLARVPWTAAMRSAVGLSVARLGLRLAGAAGR